MGKLRIEPKNKPPVGREEYAHFKKVLAEAQAAASACNVFYDLEKGESAKSVKKALLFVASEEGILLSVRALRKDNSLALRFGSSGRHTQNSSGGGGRISAGESRSRILDALRDAGRPLKKSEIVSLTGISASSWNLRIKELLDEGSVNRTETGRATAYKLG